MRTKNSPTAHAHELTLTRCGYPALVRPCRRGSSVCSSASPPRNAARTGSRWLGLAAECYLRHVGCSMASASRVGEGCAGCHQLGSCLGRARATADTPEASSVSSHPSPTTTTARLIAVTKRLAHREHRHERAAARSWLDCQQPSIGARTAAPGDEGRNSSWTPWNFRAAIDAMHS